MVRDSAGAGESVGVVVEDSLEVVVPPVGVVPLAVAVLTTARSATSASVIVYGAAVQDREAPGASEVTSGKPAGHW